MQGFGRFATANAPLLSLSRVDFREGRRPTKINRMRTNTDLLSITDDKHFMIALKGFTNSKYTGIP